MLLNYVCELSAKEKCILFSQYENISKYINNSNIGANLGLSY